MTRDTLLACDVCHMRGSDVKPSRAVLGPGGTVGRPRADGMPRAVFAGGGLNTGDGDTWVRALARPVECFMGVSRRLLLLPMSRAGTLILLIGLTARTSTGGVGGGGLMSGRKRRRVRTRKRKTGTMCLSSDSHVAAEVRAMESAPPIEAAATFSAPSRASAT